MRNLEALADALILTLKAALVPVGERQTVTETQLASALDRIGQLERDTTALRERAAALEGKTAVPGPRGPAGKDGRDGRDGRDSVPLAAALDTTLTEQPH